MRLTVAKRTVGHHNLFTNDPDHPDGLDCCKEDGQIYPDQTDGLDSCTIMFLQMIRIIQMGLTFAKVTTISSSMHQTTSKTTPKIIASCKFCNY